MVILDPKEKEEMLALLDMELVLKVKGVILDLQVKEDQMDLQDPREMMVPEDV